MDDTDDAIRLRARLERPTPNRWRTGVVDSKTRQSLQATGVHHLELLSGTYHDLNNAVSIENVAHMSRLPAANNGSKIMIAVELLCRPDFC